MNDLRYAFRQLLKTPGFTFIAVLTLAVGIGSSATMFSALRALVVEPFSYPKSEQLVQAWSNEGQPFSIPDYFDIREQATVFKEMGAYHPGLTNLGGEKAQSVIGISCSSGVLRAFGISPALGRLFEESDDKNGAPSVAIISHKLWMESFAGDPGLIGRTIRLNSAEVTVVGIMPKSFEFVGPWMRTATADVWMPLQWKRDEGDRGSHSYCVVARLKDGITPAAADAEIKTIGLRLKAAYPNSNSQKPFMVRSLYEEMTRQTRSQIWMLFGAVLLVLLVACANVASMLLSRNAGRHGEIGVRLALGASPGHILRITLSESFVLSLAGAVIGIVFAFGGIHVLRLVAPVPDARKAAMVLDGTVLLFSVALVFLTAFLAGLPSTFAALRISVADMLRTDTRSAVGSRSRHNLLRGLVIAQITVAFILANGAALFSASYMKVVAANSGLSTEYVISAAINLQGPNYADNKKRARFCEEIVSRAAALPGVTSTGTTTKLPLEGGSNMNILVNDEVFDPMKHRVLAEVSSITPDYFAAAGIALVRGRTLAPGDANEGNLGVVINRALAEKCWPGQDPLDKIIRANNAHPWFTARVIGVVDNVRQWGPESEPNPEIYWSPDRAWGQTMFLIVRSSQPAAQLAPVLRKELASIDPDLPLSRVRTLQAVVNEATQGSRVVTGLVDFFMLIALGLVAVGLFATLSYNVLQRTREIGVRVALGAARRDILALVFRQGSLWVLIGLILGIAGSLALATTLHSMVYGMGTIEPVPLLTATLAVAFAATLACWLPARRATKVDPIEALRAE